MKHLLDFLRTHNGSLFYNKASDSFVLISESIPKIKDKDVYCAFKGSNDLDVIPENPGPIWVEPAIFSIERFGDAS